MLELSAVDIDVEFAGCSTFLHLLGLANADLHMEFFTGGVEAGCVLFQFLVIFIFKVVVIGKQHLI